MVVNPSLASAVKKSPGARRGTIAIRIRPRADHDGGQETAVLHGPVILITAG
jgi:hypothetical protein